MDIAERCFMTVFILVLLGLISYYFSEPRVILAAIPALGVLYFALRIDSDSRSAGS